MRKGWFKDSFRHALAAKGVKTAKTKRNAREKRFDWKLKQAYLAEKLIGGYADGLPDWEFDPQQLYRGIQVEFEHTDDPAVAKEIAKDHLSEDENYYRDLAKMEQEEQEGEEPMHVLDDISNPLMARKDMWGFDPSKVVPELPRKKEASPEEVRRLQEAIARQADIAYEESQKPTIGGELEEDRAIARAEQLQEEQERAKLGYKYDIRGKPFKGKRVLEKDVYYPYEEGV